MPRGSDSISGKRQRLHSSDDVGKIGRPTHQPGPVVRFEGREGRFQRLTGDVRARYAFAITHEPSAKVTRTTRFSLTDRSNDACGCEPLNRLAHAATAATLHLVDTQDFTSRVALNSIKSLMA